MWNQQEHLPGGSLSSGLSAPAQGVERIPHFTTLTQGADKGTGSGVVIKLEFAHLKFTGRLWWHSLLLSENLSAEEQCHKIAGKYVND